jgi:hypothetical protein
MLMELPACAFDATTSGGVEMLMLLSEASLVQYFDDAPNAEDVTLTEEFPAEWVRDIQVRRFVFLPHELVPFMIQGALTPKAAFTALCPLIDARNLGRAGQNVKEWLIATCHRVDKVSPPLTSVSLAIRPPHRLHLMNSAQAVIFQDLPGLIAGHVAAAAPPDPEYNVVAAATHVVAEAVNQMKAGVEQPRAEAVKWPKDVYGQSMGPLMNVLWIDQRRAVLEPKFSKVASFLRVAMPCVTPAVLDLFTRAKVFCHDKNVLTEGLSPFLFLPLTPEQRSHCEREAQAYEDLLMNGMVTLAESRQINVEEAAPVPISSYADLKAVLSMYYVCLFAFFEPVPGTNGASVEEVISEFSDPLPMSF